MDVGDEEAEACASDEGWIMDDMPGAEEPSMFENAIGVAADMAQSSMELLGDVASTALDVA